MRVENHTFDLRLLHRPRHRHVVAVFVIDWADGDDRVQFSEASARQLQGHRATPTLMSGVDTVTITSPRRPATRPGSDSETFSVTVANVDPAVTLLGANSTN